MAQAISTDQEGVHPTVTEDRSLVHAIDPSWSNRSGVPTSTWSSANMWNAHGIILSFSVVLNCLGIVLIRSGFKSAFRCHWIVQALSASGVLIGCFIGVLKSTSIFQVCNQADIVLKIWLILLDWNFRLDTQIGRSCDRDWSALPNHIRLQAPHKLRQIRTAYYKFVRPHISWPNAFCSAERKCVHVSHYTL